jgi:hypothetical protein
VKSTKEENIRKTRKWLKDFVIGLNLCPFAGQPFGEEKIRYDVFAYSDIDSFISHFYEEAYALIMEGDSGFTTSLIIIPDGLEDFHFYLDVLETCQDVLDRSEMSELLQLASFHPDYQFEDSEEDDVTNYTNRSPFPMIHLLLEDEVATAIKHYGNTDNIPQINKNTLRKLGIDEVLQLIKS